MIRHAHQDRPASLGLCFKYADTFTSAERPVAVWSERSATGKAIAARASVALSEGRLWKPRRIHQPAPRIRALAARSPARSGIAQEGHGEARGGDRPRPP